MITGFRMVLSYSAFDRKDGGWKGVRDEQEKKTEKEKRDGNDPVFERSDPGGRRDALWPDQ